MNYASYVTALQTLLVVQDASGQANLNDILPNIIQYAELRMYRDPDLDFLATRTTDTTQTTTNGSRLVPIPDEFIVVESVNLVVPASTQPTAAGAQRIPLLRTTISFLDQIWPQESLTKTPAPFETYFSIFGEEETNSSLRIAPTPNGAYVAEIRGTFRPEALSATNPNTFLTEYMPDMFLAASMYFGAGYQRNFGSEANDPQMAQFWDDQYEKLKTSAAVEEARKRATSAGWTAYAPQQVAQQPRI